MTNYSEDDIKVITWEEGVRKRREMYFGSDEVNGEEIGEAIKYPAVVLGSKESLITKLGDWHYFCSDIDWLFLSEHEIENARTVFESPRPFPEGGSPNSYRTESLCLPFSTDAFTVSGDDRVLLKGKYPSKYLLEKHLDELGKWGRIVGYRFNENA